MDNPKRTDINLNSKEFETVIIVDNLKIFKHFIGIMSLKK